MDGVCGCRVNVGCGATPTPGWINVDNSWTVRLARVPGAIKVLEWIGLLGAHQIRFAAVARATGIRYARATRLPLDNKSCSVVYSSHMIEHLSRCEASAFVREAFRILRPGGVLRLVVPDVAKLVRQYEKDGDADRLIEGSMLASDGGGAARRALLHLTGPRNHQWMYDGKSLSALVEANGFVQARILEAGQTSIPSPGELNLRERGDESACVEAWRP